MDHGIELQAGQVLCGTHWSHARHAGSGSSCPSLSRQISGRICRKCRRLRSVRAINGCNQLRNDAPVADGDYAACVRILAPAAAEAVRVGGSHAKREVIEDTLLIAMMKSGQTA